MSLIKFSIEARTIKDTASLIKLLIVSSVFNASNGVFSGFITVYFAKYLEEELGFDDWAYGVILSIGITLYLVTVIVSGAFSDDLRNEKWGNRIPFIITGGFLMGMIFILAYSIMSLFEANLLVIIILFGGIYIAYGIIASPNNALMSELFEKHMRGWSALSRMVFGGIGTGIAIVVFPSLADSGNYEQIFIIIAVVLFICSVLVALFVPRLNPDFEPDETIPDILATPQYLVTYGRGDFGKLMVCQVFWALGTGAVYYYWAAYFIYKFDVSAEEVAGVLIVLSIGAAFAAIPVGISVSVIGKVNTGIISSLIYCVFIFLVSSATTLESLYIYMFIGGVAAIGLSTVSGALPADLVPEGKEAQFMGINTFFSLFPDPLTLIVAAFLLGFFGEEDGYQILFAIVIIEVLIAAIALAFISYERWVSEKYQLYYTRFLRAKNKLPDRTWLGITITEYFEESKKEF
ncbi:MAG: MFS transporter [Candidatus Heimdallarchaeota archaeon]